MIFSDISFSECVFSILQYRFHRFSMPSSLALWSSHKYNFLSWFLGFQSAKIADIEQPTSSNPEVSRCPIGCWKALRNHRNRGRLLLPCLETSPTNMLHGPYGSWAFSTNIPWIATAQKVTPHFLVVNQWWITLKHSLALILGGNLCIQGRKPLKIE